MFASPDGTGLPMAAVADGKFIKRVGNQFEGADPPGGGGGTPSDTVVTETGFGQSSDAGVATEFSRGDHTHGSPTDPVPVHEAAADPHTQYQRESEKSAANGYASLSAATRVPTAELGSGVADGTKFLRGDQAWAVPPGGGGGADVKADIETAITEGSSRSVTFTTAFATTPNVVVGFADNSAELSVCTAHTVSTTGFTIAVNKIGGGGSSNRDVSWIATDAGDP